MDRNSELFELFHAYSLACADIRARKWLGLAELLQLEEMETAKSEIYELIRW